MLFRVFEKDELRPLYAALAAGHTIIGPMETARDCRGRPVHAFEETAGFDDLKLDYPTTRIPAKRWFLPYRETMATFRMDGRDWQKTIEQPLERPHAFFGLHACDINALNRLDKVLLHGVYPMPSYAARRANMFIIGVDCMPQPYCFCRSMGTDTVLHGFDMFITDIGDRYFVEIMSASAFNLLKAVRTALPGEEDHVRYMHTVARKNSSFTSSVDTTDLAKILDMEFQSPVWEHWGSQCLGCGNCSSVCPTCYCYGVEEQAGTGLRDARKVKILYSCTMPDFAEVAGGHNFRPERSIRLKYRYYHKHRGFVEAYEEPLCVGCGRCGEACLAGITVPGVIASLRGEEAPLERHAAAS